MDEGQLFSEINLAKSPFEARVIVIVLQNAGIPARVDGALLQDEFAISQAMMNNLGVRITVPTDQLEAAYSAIEEARGTELEFAQPPAPPPQREAGDWLGFRPPTVILTLLCFTFLGFWIDARSQITLLTADALHDFHHSGEGGSATWKGTNVLSQTWEDFDLNNVWEQWTVFNRAGRKLSTAHDDDQNGIFERFMEFAADGRLAAVSTDLDQDGSVETWEVFYPSGVTVTNHDADGDKIFERREVFGPDKTKLFEEVDRGAEGHVRR
jgi:hypothetical protein